MKERGKKSLISGYTDFSNGFTNEFLKIGSTMKIPLARGSKTKYWGQKMRGRSLIILGRGDRTHFPRGIEQNRNIAWQRGHDAPLFLPRDHSEDLRVRITQYTSSDLTKRLPPPQPAPPSLAGTSLTYAAMCRKLHQKKHEKIPGLVFSRQYL